MKALIAAIIALSYLNVADATEPWKIETYAEHYTASDDLPKGYVLASGDTNMRLECFDPDAVIVGFFFPKYWQGDESRSLEVRVDRHQPFAIPYMNIEGDPYTYMDMSMAPAGLIDRFMLMVASGQELRARVQRRSGESHHVAIDLSTTSVAQFLQFTAKCAAL